MDTETTIAQKDATIAEQNQQLLMLQASTEKLAEKDALIFQLQQELAQLKRFIFGQKRERAEFALQQIQKLYRVEREAKESGLTANQLKELRQTQSVPVLNELHEWMKAEYQRVTPKSPIGKAIQYTLARWDGLSAYSEDGRFEIDNNYIENAIRPVALGRKNYLFAGSHDAAQNAAIIYSLLGSCEKNEVNPYHYLLDVINRISTYPTDQLDNVLPHKWRLPEDGSPADNTEL